MRFTDLPEGAYFISAPDEGDSGEGLYVFRKWVEWQFGPKNDERTNCFRLRDGIQSHMPDSMPVVRILL